MMQLHGSKAAVMQLEIAAGQVSTKKKKPAVNKYVTRGCRNSVRNIEATFVLPALLQQ